MADFVNICSFDEGDMLDVLRIDKPFPLSASVICLEKLKADRLVTRDLDAIALAPGIACTLEGFSRTSRENAGSCSSLSICRRGAPSDR